MKKTSIALTIALFSLGCQPTPAPKQQSAPPDMQKYMQQMQSMQPPAGAPAGDGKADEKKPETTAPAGDAVPATDPAPGEKKE